MQSHLNIKHSNISQFQITTPNIKNLNIVVTLHPHINIILYCLVPAHIPTQNMLFCFPLQFRNFKIIYRRYAGLYFCICVDVTDNNLAYLEAIHNFVEVNQIQI